jgi:hypothetical protein
VSVALHSFRLTRSEELRREPVLGVGLSGIFPARATLDLDCSGDGWRVSASIANTPTLPASPGRLAAVLTEVVRLVLVERHSVPGVEERP